MSRLGVDGYDRVDNVLLELMLATILREEPGAAVHVTPHLCFPRSWSCHPSHPTHIPQGVGGGIHFKERFNLESDSLLREWEPASSVHRCCTADALMLATILREEPGAAVHVTPHPVFF